ncbi:MAG: hypothetical protein EOL95_01850 [Bacteroidia bacterium]|nr:hypothetical protein [Bacteroidia bacterium]
MIYVSDVRVNQRTDILKKIFTKEESCRIEDSAVDISFFEFKERGNDSNVRELQHSFLIPSFIKTSDDAVNENSSFRYPMVRPPHHNENACILLFHGLNERSWDKHAIWAETLARMTGKPVILFPIAFHINRTPSSWYNPRVLMHWVADRRKRTASAENVTFANLALSSRLSSSPLRFYTSGRETCYDVAQLMDNIKAGKHPYLNENTKIDIFAYSIGALMSQIMLLSNYKNMFENARLFMFCGGSIFNMMNGNSPYIMDSQAFLDMIAYYQNDHLFQAINNDDPFDLPFKSMIDANYYTDYRTDFFNKAQNRIQIISLAKDKVIPYKGICAALGAEAAAKCVIKLDYPFEYSHEMPFPTKMNATNEVDKMFMDVFGRAANFLS